MELHVFGDESRPKILLIHGVLTPWQIWEKQIENFISEYCVIVAELDAHEQERSSMFVSIEDEARQLEDSCCERFGRELFAVCGLSMGGAIANILWKNGRLKIQKIVMDGAPLIPSGKLLEWFMTKQYISLIRRSKKRDPKVMESFKRDFLPEKYLANYLKLADNMQEQAIKNMISSVCTASVYTDIPEDGSRVLFMHGTKGNEVLSRKAGALIKKHYPKSVIICFDGYKHCEAAIYEPDKWIRYVEEFLNA